MGVVHTQTCDRCRSSRNLEDRDPGTDGWRKLGGGQHEAWLCPVCVRKIIAWVHGPAATLIHNRPRTETPDART